MDPEAPEEAAEPELVRAARDVGRAIEAHARTVLDNAQDIGGIVVAASALREAVLRYEERLMSETGWSNPVRHLGRLPQYSHDDQEGDATPGDLDAAVRVRVAASYVVAVSDEDVLANFVEGRGGDRPSSVEDAVRFLYESDSWDVLQYPPGRVRLVQADVGISVD